MAAVTIHSDFGAQENKVGHCFHSFPIYLTGSDELDAMNLVFSTLRFKPAFSLPSFSFIKRLFCYSSLSAIQFRSVAESCPVFCDPHGLQHARPPSPSPTPRVCSNLCPSKWWCHSTISSSAIRFSTRLHSFSASGSFPVSQFFAWGGQSIGISASAWVHPVDIWTDFL